MSHTLLEAAEAIRADFLPAEDTVGRAAVETARLLATVLEQHGKAELAIGAGAGLVRKLARSLAAQLEAREEFAMAHKLAAALPRELGLDPAMFGDVVPCPPDERRENGEAGTVVRLAA